MRHATRLSKSEFFITMVFLLMVLLPLMAILWNILTPVLRFEFSAFTLFADSRILLLFGRSLLLSCCVVICTFILALSFAYFFGHFNFYGKRILFISTLVPLFIPAYISAISWQYALGSNGWLSNLLQIAKPEQFLSGFGGSLFVLTLWLFPLMMLFIYNAFRVGKPYQEVAMLHRHKWGRQKFIISFLARHGILSGGILIFVLAFTNFSIPGALQLNVFPTEIFAMFGAFFDVGQAAVLSLPNLIIALILAFVISRQFRQQERFELLAFHQTIEILKGWKALGACGFLSIILLFIIGTPIATLIYRTGSLNIFFDAFINTYNQWINSFLLGLAGALIICCIAFFMALVARKRPWLQLIFMTLLLLPLFVSGSLYAIGLIEVWNQPVFQGLIYGSPALLIISYLRFLPVGYFVISAGLLKLPFQFEEIGQLSGRKRSAIIYKIIFPLIKPGFFGALLLTFIFCFSELDTAVLTYPPGMETVPVRIFALLHYGTHETVAALCLWQLLIIIAIVMLFSGMIVKWRKGVFTDTKDVAKTSINIPTAKTE